MRAKGTSGPSSLAVLRLITSSNRVGCMTGKIRRLGRFGNSARIEDHHRHASRILAVSQRKSSFGKGPEQKPLARYSSQGVWAALLKHQAGTGHKVTYGLRDEHLARGGEPGYARADMHRDASELLARELAFAGMDATAHLAADRAHRVADRAAPADRPRRPVDAA